jgi:hypothetical protein
MKIELMRCGASQSAAATFGSAADVRPLGGVDVEGSPVWSPPV